jgi:putative nucleotidyltransferase with HDIG domain
MKTSSWRTTLEVAGTAIAFKATSDIAALFSTADTSFLFPPSAVIFTAGAAFGRWGVLGVALGSLLSRWGAAASWPGALAFAAVHAVTTAIVAAALRRPRRGTGGRLQRAFWVAGGVAHAVSAVLGTAALIALGDQPWTPAAVLDNLLIWWMSGVAAALVLGVPLLLALRPETLLAPPDHQRLRTWLAAPEGARLSIALVIACILPIALGTYLGWGFPHWLALVLVTPIGLAALQAGAGPALIANSLASVAYVAALIASGRDAGELRQLLAPGYTTIGFFTCFAFGGGWLAGRNRRLIEKVRAQEQQLRRDFERTVAALAAAIEAKDPTTEGHVQRVAELTGAVGERLGLSPQEVATLRFGALLHDVGKIGVPERILNKRDRLTADEKAEMERHVEIGLRIIRDVEVLQPVEPLIRYHQERWDGQSGALRYPGYFGLKGEEIPIGARILAVVDAFDAITNDRPYRSGRSVPEALEELEREAGRQFDPAVVAALTAVVRARALAPAMPTD